MNEKDQKQKPRRGRGEGEYHLIRPGVYEGRACRVVNGKRERKNFYGTRVEVLDQLAAWRSNPKRKGRVTSVLVRHFLQGWLAEVKAANRQATYALREGTVRRHVLPYIGDLRLDLLERDQIRGWQGALADAKVGARTRQIALATLTCALNAAIDEELIAVNPCARIRSPRVPKRDRYILNIEESKRLLDAADGDPYHALYVLALRTGMRQGELFALEWQSIDLASASLRVEATLTEDEHGRLHRTDTKTAASRRSVAISPATVAALREHRERTAWREGLVFRSQDGLAIRKSNFIRRFFHPLLERANLPHITFHSLRHVANSVLLANGASPLEAAERLGHTDTRMTLDTYGHVLGNAQRALADRLDAMFELPNSRVIPNEHAR